MNILKMKHYNKILKHAKLKSAFSMSEFIRINHINKRDIKYLETHDDGIILHYYVNMTEG